MTAQQRADAVSRSAKRDHFVPLGIDADGFRELRDRDVIVTANRGADGEAETLRL